MTVLEPIEHTNRDFVGSLAKGLRVLKTFNEGNERMTVSDVARVAELPRAGARRLLLTMHALGYMNTDGKYYSLSPKVLELGFSFISSQNWLTLSSHISAGRLVRDQLLPRSPSRQQKGLTGSSACPAGRPA